MGERPPGSGVAQASSFNKKGHPIGIKLQNTPRDGAEHREDETEAQGTGEESGATTWYRQGTGPPVEANRGGRGREADGGRQREDGNLGEESQPERGRQARLTQGTPLSLPTWKGSADERWQPTGGSAVQVDSRSATGR